MKKISYLIPFLCLIFFLFSFQFVYADVFKWIRVGKYQTKVVDSGDQGEGVGAFTTAYYYYNDFKYRYGVYSACGYYLGAKDWNDEEDNYWPVKISNSPYGVSNEVSNTMPYPDNEGMTIRKYMRFQPPTIIVDGFPLEDPFPVIGDEVNPDEISGTADAMVESWFNTSMGVSVHQKVLGWNQTNHDDYVIYDWTFTNTGNVDTDEEIELPNQTINDFYFMRINRWSGMGRSWSPQHFGSAYGEFPGDSLRMTYMYPGRTQGSSYDNLGTPITSQGGWLRDPMYRGETFMHVDKSADDDSDDQSQPQMTGVGHPETACIKIEANQLTPADLSTLYQIMSIGFLPSGVPEMEGTYPGTHHSVRMEDRGLQYNKEIGFGGRLLNLASSGPFTLAPGESIRMVWAMVIGTIAPEEGYEIGNKWYNKIDIEPPEGCVFGVTDNLPPHYKNYPALYAADKYATEYNNWAKDCWVHVGKDSLFQNAWNANWNLKNNHNVPNTPPPPSIEIASLPDRIGITWGNESESASDFAGYRVYRALGNPGPIATSEGMIGVWELIFDCGDGTANALTHSYDDIAAERGQGYYYCVTAFDDGIANIPDVNGKKESLETCKYLNRTTQPAFLTRPAGTLSTVRVVPNPFNIGAADLQYIGEPDKIMFLDIPGYCTIKIYSESGDLIKTLYHTDGSGDESWGVLLEEHSATEEGQLIVSGIYIAVIEKTDADGTPTGESTALKFVVVR